MNLKIIQITVIFLIFLLPFNLFSQNFKQIGKFDFNGNFHNDITNSILKIEKDTTVLELKDNSLKVHNDNGKFSLYFNGLLIKKLKFEAKAYHSNTGDNYVLQNYVLDNNQGEQLICQHNFYHNSGSSYPYKYHDNFNLRYSKWSNGVLVDDKAELAENKFNQWITETVTIDFEGKTSKYERINSDGTMDIVALSDAVPERKDSMSVRIDKWDWCYSCTEFLVDYFYVYAEYFSPEISIPQNIPTVNIGQIVEIPIFVDKLSVDDNIISYQFDLGFDDTKLEFIEANLSGTIAEGGTLDINPNSNNSLAFGYMSSTPLSGEGGFINLKFKTKGCGTSDLTISNFKFNNIDITDIKNGFITSNCLLGDVDGDGIITAYDAALVLQYSIGLNPLPSLDPIPWDDWRITVADVDGDGIITANDASLILQYSIGKISIFPAGHVSPDVDTEGPGEEHNNDEPSSDDSYVGDYEEVIPEGNAGEGDSQSDNNGDDDIDFGKKSSKEKISISCTGNEILFKANNELYGLNIFANSSKGLGEPVLLNEDMIMATNITEKNYAIGVCTAYSPESGEVFLKIPYSGGKDLSFNMSINAENKTVTVNTTTGIAHIEKSNIIIYPVPAQETITIKGLIKKSELKIYSLQGELVKQQMINYESINISNLKQGIYFVEILDNGKVIATQKIIKK